jgi:iron uptake system EfeUOB component EfeO/EfeM
MYKFVGFSLWTVLTLSLFMSCGKDEPVVDTDEAKNQKLTAIVEQFVSASVVPTYKSLADESAGLYDALVALKASKTNDNVRKATEKWISARDYWELSEAFLFGPASDFGIDPHIDTWPLAKDELVAALANDAQINSMNSEAGDEWVAAFLGAGLLGFHGIEYILFKDGQPKDAAQIAEKELIYAVAVAGDLRNQCFCLEASWAGIDKVTAEKKEKLEALEMNVTLNSGDSYGEDMLNAGKPGSTKKTVVSACETIVEGCITIADEVGAMKIGRPHTGEDVNYIESPYSYNSKVDFIGNIKSIQNVYLGGIEGKRGASLSDYIKSVDADLDTKIKNAINDAIAKIEAIPYPFAKNFISAQAGEAMEACNDLSEILGEAKQALLK